MRDYRTTNELSYNLKVKPTAFIGSKFYPGSIFFNRHIFLNIPLEEDLLALQNMQQRKIQINLIKQNKKRWNYDYKVGQRVLIRNKGQSKMEAPIEGPFPIVQVYTNGTVALKRKKNVLEIINI